MVRIAGQKEFAIVMDRRAFLTTTAGAAAALVLASCKRSVGTSPAPPTIPGDVDPRKLPPLPRPTLRLAGGDFGLPSPFSYLVGPGYGRMIFIYDTLLQFDAQEQVVPWLASAYSASPDGIVHTFEIRDNARWHDGKPVTADDIKFTFDYTAAQLDLAAAATGPSPLIIGAPEGVKEVRVLGPRTVEVHLDRSYTTFARNVASTLPMVPKHIWEGIENASQSADERLLVGSGPYRLKSYRRGEGAYLYVANDDFFLGKPFVKRIELRPVDDDLIALRAGEIDVAGAALTGTTPDVLEPFEDSDEYSVVKAEAGSGLVFALYWNLAKGAPMNDVRFRHACAKAINRKRIVDRLAKGDATPGNPGFLPPTHEYHHEVEQYPFDPAGANRLLDEMGYRREGKGPRQGPDGNPLRVQLMATVAVGPVAELVKADLKAVGIDFKVRAVDGPTLFTNTGDYEMALMLYAGQAGDPDYMRVIYSSMIENQPFHHVRGWSNPEFDDLAERQRAITDVPERKKLVARMQEIVAAELPLLHLYYPDPVSIFRKEAFDQWALAEDASVALNKDVLVTGMVTGGTTIRPFEE